MQTRLNEIEMIRCDKMTDNETWHYCPDCGHNWKEKISTPGLLLSMKCCEKCEGKRKVS